MPSKIDFPPVYLPASAGNILNGNITAVTGPVGFTLPEPFIVVRHIRIINIDTVIRTVSLYKGATGGSTSSTQFAWGNYPLAAQNYDDWYGEQRFNAADFLSGICDAASKVIINIDAEIEFP